MKNWLKKQFKYLLNETDIKFLLINAKFKIIYQIIFIFSGFFITWCFANFASITFYGIYLQISSIVALFSFLAFTGINQSLVQSVANDYDFFFKTSIKKIFKFSFSGTLAIFSFTLIYSLFIEYNFLIIICLAIVATFFPFISIMFSYTYFLDGKGEFNKNLIFQLLNLLFSNLLILFLIFITKNLILHFLLLYSIQIILNSFITKKCLNAIENKELNEEKDKEALSYGYFFVKYGFLSLICFNINYVIIGFYYSPEDLALYVIGTGLILSLTIIIKPSFSVLLINYSKKNSQISKKFLVLILFGSFLLFIFVIFVGLPLYLRFFFPKYINSLSYGIFYSFILLIYPFVVVIGYYFRGKIDKKVVGIAIFLSNIIFLISIAPLLLLFGIYGLILNEFLKVFTIFIVYLVNIRKINFK